MVAVGKTPTDVLPVAALVERTAEIRLGATGLGGAIELPEKVNWISPGSTKHLRTN
jgi:ribulose-5-phosphate 4-epimerase/fuculose-1-phosphate aldolase